MNELELQANKKEFNNSQDMLKDLLQGDPYAFKKLESMNLDMKAIKLALDTLTSRPGLDDKDKYSLLSESWRVAFRDRPPTPEEFLTEKYIGPTAKTIYPRIRKIFLDFMDPTQQARNLVLYPFIGFGKAQPLDAKIYVSKSEFKKMGDIETGDRVLSPSGKQVEVLEVKDWENDDVYELKMEDGKKIKTGAHHLHHVSYRKDKERNPIWENVETLFILNHPELEFTFQEVDTEGISNGENLHTVLFKYIKYLGKQSTRCITVNSFDGLYVTDGGIVTHNSFLSTLITLYISVVTSLMRNPYKYFGLSPATVIAQMLVSYSIKKSKELLLDPYLNIMGSSPFFEKVNRKDSMKEMKAEFENRDHVDKLYFTTADPTSELMFDSGIAIKCASNPRNLTGLSILSGVCSELMFFRDAGKSDDFILRVWNDLKGRVYSRMKGNFYGVSILDSSPNSLTSPLESWVWYDAANDPGYYVVKGSIWQWNPEEYAEDFKKGDTFKIFTGGKGQVPRILDPLDPMLSDPLADQSKIIDVPAKGPDGKMRSYFEEDLIKSLKDFAGIPAGAADSLITDYQVIEDMFDNNLKNIYLNITAPANESPKRLIWNQVKDTFFKNIAGKYEYYYLPHVARCISVDQSEVTDVTSISMAHVERDKESSEIMYVIDFTIAIVPDSNRVNLAAIEEFIRDLRYLGNMTITKVSFDRFQSSVTIQNLKRDKFDVENLSVDRTTGPYLNLLSLLNRRRIVCGKNIFFKNNLKSLILSHTKGNNNAKIDHDSSSAQVLVGDPDWDTSFIGYYGKDVSDSVAAVCELCTSEFPVAQVNWEPTSIKERSLAQENKEEATTKVNDFLKKFGLK